LEKAKEKIEEDKSVKKSLKKEEENLSNLSDKNKSVYIADAYKKFFLDKISYENYTETLNKL